MEEGSIEARLQRIEERNRRVQLNKAWETSKIRRISIAAITYLAALFYLFMIDEPRPFLVGLIPAGAYVLSSLSLPFIRRSWEDYYENLTTK